MARVVNDPDRRVVVTGMGVVTTIGDTIPTFFDALLRGQSGITRWKRMDDRILSKIGGDLSDFDALEHLARAVPGCPASLVERARRLLRTTPFAGRLTACAALQAYLDSGLVDAPIEPERIGHTLAAYNLNQNFIVENAWRLAADPDEIDPLLGLIYADTDVLSVASELVGIKGPSFTNGGACASGNIALLSGLDLLRAGRASAVLVSGGAVDFSPAELHSWATMGAVSCESFNDEPARASRPFDGRREGFVPAHGAGALILETLSAARARGARVHAEFLGGAAASDASRLAKPVRDGQVRAMRAALADAGVSADEVDYVNAHGTSTRAGDGVEVGSLKVALGERARRIPVNSTKSMIGHCVAAAGVVELIATILQMQHGVVHPTINLDAPDPELDLDFVPNQSRPHRIEVAMSNSFGFGGLNSSVLVGRAPQDR